MANLTEIKNYFLNLNKTLTIALVAVLVSVSAVIWYTNVITIQNSSSLIGASFMVLAVLFYQLPYISYLLTRRHFKADAGKQGAEILSSDWKTFKNWVQS